MNDVPKSYLVRNLATELRQVASIMPLPEPILGNSFTLRLTKAQADRFRKLVDRGAVICEQYAEVKAREEGAEFGAAPDKHGPKMRKAPAKAEASLDA